MQRIKLISGLVMLVLSITLVVLFLFPDFHFRWWSANTYFLVLTIVGVLLALFGSYFVRSFIYRGKEKESIIFDVLGHVGFLLVAGGILLGAGALLIAMDVNTNTGVGLTAPGMAPAPVVDRDYHYPQDFLVMDSQTWLLCLAILITIVGQFTIGFSKKRRAE
jgi:hypothetical protein